jgi:hypothetical protein
LRSPCLCPHAPRIEETIAETIRVRFPAPVVRNSVKNSARIAARKAGRRVSSHRVLKAGRNTSRVRDISRRAPNINLVGPSLRDNPSLQPERISRLDPISRRPKDIILASG